MKYLLITVVLILTQSLFAMDYHVSVQGSDSNQGSAAKPLKTISAAAELAQPGDQIIIHAGTYRERIIPPRGGSSNSERITYRAAGDGEVVVKGSEEVSGWKRDRDGIWKVVLANSFFGEYNPYKDVIAGDWFKPEGRDHHTGEVYLNGDALFEEVSVQKLRDHELSWYCEFDDQTTSIWANFGNSDPDNQRIEINARPTCFYSDTPGKNYITIKGITFRHAATQWAAPTAEQIGLIGTHWSKGWIIEDCVISDSKCVGITLGKDRASGHNSAQSAVGYNVVVRKALDEGGWSRENIGSHIVRDNTIYSCGAAGICGSMGGAFSQLTGNHIYDICINKPYGGAEMAGIKLHAPIDTLIADNHIHDTIRGIWMDWMTQGTRITGNLLYRNQNADLFVEVNHGPFVVDNNLMLSHETIRDWSQGGAYVHNLIAGEIIKRPVPDRETPYHKPHSTEIRGLRNIDGGDNRYYNNIFATKGGLAVYDDYGFHSWIANNLHLNGSTTYNKETDSVQLLEFDAQVTLHEKDGTVELELRLPEEIEEMETQRITTELLGKAKIPGAPYEDWDARPLTIYTDYYGNWMDAGPLPGPFARIEAGPSILKVWPK